MAEVLGCRRLRKRPDRPKEGDAERLLERQACRHHFAEEPGDAFLAQRTGIPFLNSAQDLRLTLRAIDDVGLPVMCLETTDRLRATGAAIEQRQQLGIDRIDLCTDWREF